jgi:hypothetical protein
MLHAYKDAYQGFGRINLDTVLKFNSSLSLYVKDDVPIAQGGVKSYRFIIPSDQAILPFRVTMTWTGKYVL